jgi:predicted RNA-binding protein with PIN domain
MMKIMVDGHNLMHADDEARAALDRQEPDRARVRLLEVVGAFARYHHKQALIVFDGSGGHPLPESARGPVQYCFSGPDRKADDVLLDRLRSSTGRREILVVTSDREVADAARHLGAKVQASAAFLQEVERLGRRRQKKKPAPEPSGKRRGPSATEVEEMLMEFTEEDAAAIERAESRPRRRKRNAP